MEHYEIIADSVTGVKGKLLRKEEIHAESEFMPGHCAELVANGAIKRATHLPHIITEEDMEINPDLKEAGVSVGETIEIPINPELEPTAE